MTVATRRCSTVENGEGVFRITYTAVKAKASAPLPPHTSTCAALTRHAVCALGPHREGTRSRRCGRRLTGAGGGLLTSGRKERGPIRRLMLTWPPGPLASVSFLLSGIHPCRQSSRAGAAPAPPVGERRGPVSVPLPTLDKEYGLQTLIRCTNTLPSLLLRVKLQICVRVLRSLFRQGATCRASSLSIVH